MNHYEIKLEINIWKIPNIWKLNNTFRKKPRVKEEASRRLNPHVYNIMHARMKPQTHTHVKIAFNAGTGGSDRHKYTVKRRNCTGCPEAEAAD